MTRLTKMQELSIGERDMTKEKKGNREAKKPKKDSQGAKKPKKDPKRYDGI